MVPQVLDDAGHRQSRRACRLAQVEPGSSRRRDHTSTIRAIISKRAATNDEWQDGVERCWAELTDALTENIDTTRKFLLEDCTADEASWISEVYDDIVYKTQSREYIDLLRKSIERFPEEDKKRHLTENLELTVRTMLLDD